MKPQEHFDQLCRSAFDFLLRSTQEIESDPKYALLHFALGLELLQKARLYEEHWSLIVTSQPSLKALTHGDFSSVSCKEAMGRLETIVGQPVPADAKKTFETIIKHRNKIVHFYHDGLGQAELRSAIAGDICKGWFHLRDRLRVWKSEFKTFDREMRQLEGKMRSVRTFLQIVYDTQLADLKSQQAKGADVTTCPACGFDAALLGRVTSKLFVQHCKVCDLDAPLVRFACADSDCGLELSASGWNGFQSIQCTCGATNIQGDLKTALDTSSYENTNPPESIACPNCCSDDTVVEHDHLYICVECLSYSVDLGHCEFCGQGQLGGEALEETMLHGCGFCEGTIGRFKDD